MHTRTRKDQNMATERITVTVNKDVAEECRRLAEEEERSLSNWISRVLSEKVKDSKKGKR